jgi:PAS domain S-box-containing protein
LERIEGSVVMIRKALSKTGRIAQQALIPVDDFHWTSAGLLTVLVLAVTFLVDLITPLGYAASGLYFIAVVISAAARSSRSIQTTAAIAVVLTILGGLLSPPSQPTAGWLNRVIDLFVIVIATGLCMRLRHFLVVAHQQSSNSARRRAGAQRLIDEQRTQLNAQRQAFSSTVEESDLAHAALAEKTQQLQQQRLDFSRDIDRRNETESQLRASEERFRDLLESAPDAMIIVDHDGLMCLVNTQAERMFGYQRDELLGQPIEMLMHESLREKQVQHRQIYFADPGTRPMGTWLDLVGLHRDGSELPVEIRLSPLQIENETFVTTAIRDVSVRRRTEETVSNQRVELQQNKESEKKAKLRSKEELEQINAQLERSNLDLEQFAYVASHDLQEPLRAITGYVQLLELELADQLDEVSLQYIHHVVEGAQRMKRIISDLLDYSRVQRKGNAFAELDTNEIVRNVIEDLRIAIEETHAEIQCQQLPMVVADASQLERVFHNLIGNAIKYHGPDTPRIEITCETTDDSQVFSISDNGIGIEPRFYDRIFAIFQRLHTRDEYPGTGIGLTLSKRIVERHGGRIWVDSHVGEGTTFHFSIPVARVIHHEKEYVISAADRDTSR